MTSKPPFSVEMISPFASETLSLSQPHPRCSSVYPISPFLSKHERGVKWRTHTDGLHGVHTSPFTPTSLQYLTNQVQSLSACNGINWNGLWCKYQNKIGIFKTFPSVQSSPTHSHSPVVGLPSTFTWTGLINKAQDPCWLLPPIFQSLRITKNLHIPWSFFACSCTKLQSSFLFN